MRKHTPVLLLLFFALLGCSKEQVEPDLSAAVKGNYEVYYFQLGEDKINLPFSGVSMGVRIDPLTKNTANYTLTVNANGNIESDTAEIDLSGNEDSVIITDKATKEVIGGIKEKLFEINIILQDGQRFVIKAKK